MELFNNRYITEKQVSAMTNLALSTLRNHRFNGVGIPYVKLDKSVRYKLQDVIDYFEEHKIVTLNER